MSAAALAGGGGVEHRCLLIGSRFRAEAESD